MTFAEETTWWKRPWVWLVAALGFILGLAGFVFTLGRRPVRPPRPEGLKPNPRPSTPDVEVPKIVKINTNVAEDFKADKDKTEDVKDVVSDLNSRFD